MADPEIQITSSVELGLEQDGGDVEMEGEDGVELGETAATLAGGPEVEEVEEEHAPPRVTFIDYLKSPIVDLIVGSGASQTLLSAHQALLAHSPFFAEMISQFPEELPRSIELSTEELDPVGCFLQYLYTGEYFPRKIKEGLEEDPDMPGVDLNGEKLLKHARVLAIADKFGVMELKNLAHSKIHRVNSSARGEIAYARFIYGNTPRSDKAVRKPIASFWGQRSHVLRHDAEEDFQQLCLEFPEFGFDVLSHVLDERERGSGMEREPKSARKRPRGV